MIFPRGGKRRAAIGSVDSDRARLRSTDLRSTDLGSHWMCTVSLCTCMMCVVARHMVSARQFLIRATSARGNAAQGTSLPTEESIVLETVMDEQGRARLRGTTFR